ncbi:unnamed protein product [Dicrocoelium dendriticum]|nr:unnamed protein product [Dicrocoelium dendriticum]
MSEVNFVSTLWSTLVHDELERVKSVPELAATLLRKHPDTCDHSESISKLVQDARSTYASAAYYRAVVRYVDSAQASDALKRIHNFVDDLASGQISMKSSKRAKQFRELGNRLFKLGCLPSAARAYQSGLLYAPNAFPSRAQDERLDEESMEACLLHGNLSAVLLKQSMHIPCLWQSLMALQLHLSRGQPTPPSMVTRLWSRVQRCSAAITHAPFSIVGQCEAPTLSFVNELQQAMISGDFECSDHHLSFNCELPEAKYGFHSSYPGLSAGLEVVQSPLKGRHVVSTAIFEPGEVMAVEPASGWTVTPSRTAESVPDRLLILPSQRMSKCSACLSPLSSIGFVCPWCYGAAYCAAPSACYTTRIQVSGTNPAFRQPLWHESECRFTFLLNSTGLGHLCFRLAWLRRQNASSLASVGVVTVDDLVEHFEKFTVVDLFEYALTAWLLSKILANCTPIGVDREMIDGLWCFDTLRRLQLNAHALTEVQDATPLELDEATVDDAATSMLILPHLRQVRVATGLFPCVSLLNHACEPTTSISFQGSFIILRCTKPVKPGDEVFTCYGPHFLHDVSRTRRRAQLRKQYFFECDCEHCTDSRCQHDGTPDATRLLLWEYVLSEVANVGKTDASLNHIQFLWLKAVDVGTIGCEICGGYWWPEETKPGALFDTIAAHCFAAGKLTSDTDASFNLNLVGWFCSLYSIAWVFQHYGPTSPEYVWELVNLIRTGLLIFGEWPRLKRPKTAYLRLPVNQAVPPTLEEVLDRIYAVSSIHYGHARTVRMLRLLYSKHCPSHFEKYN